jgi:hypothetical protein
MLGHGVGRIARYTRYGDAQFLGGLQIDIVKSSTTQSNQTDARTCQAFEDLAVENIIYKHADRLRPLQLSMGKARPESLGWLNCLGAVYIWGVLPGAKFKVCLSPPSI